MLTPDTFHQILQESEILSDLFFHQVLQESEIVLGWMGLGFQPGFENSQDIKVTKTIKHDETGLELTLEMKHDEAFQRAFATVGEELNTRNPLTKNTLSRQAMEAKKDEMHKNVALMFVIGEYLLAKWNVQDTDGKPLATNGDNFLKLFEHLGQTEQGLVCVTMITNAFQELMEEYYDKIQNIKKK